MVGSVEFIEGKFMDEFGKKIPVSALRDDSTYLLVGASVAGWTVTAVKTADYTAANGEIVPVDATGGAVTVTVPHTANAVCAVLKTDTSLNAVTIASTLGGVDGGTETLAGQYQGRMLAGTGSAVSVVGERVPFGSPAALGGASTPGVLWSKARADHIHSTRAVINTQTASYTLLAADEGKVIHMNVAGANVLTVPALTAGMLFEVYAQGAGQTTVTADSGVTLRAPNGAKTAHQYATLALRYISSTEVVLSGDTAV